MALIPKYKEGSNISIMNAIYKKPKMNEETGKYSKDFATIIYKDANTGKKGQYTMYEPTYEFYVAKDSVYIPPEQHLFFIEKDKVDKHTVQYTQLDKYIASITGNTDFFYENCRTGNRKANNQLHYISSIFSSDVNIEDHLRARFAMDYENDVIPITKAYFDIETDIHYCNNDFPTPGQVPVNAISYINDEYMTEYVFILRDKNNPQIEEFEKSISPELFEEIKEFIKTNVGGDNGLKKFRLENFNYELFFFDEEIQLIQAFFALINKQQPDFLLAWNMAFDIPYLIERCKVLGYDPAIILSHPDFTEKFADYWIDVDHKDDYEARGDYYKISSYTTFIDQLIQFASIRKGQSAFPNFKLDTAGEIITKGIVRKLDYSHITTQLGDLPYLDFKTFIFYNMMDPIVCKCIEESVGDIDYIFGAAIMNDTRYAKVHRQTVYLTNLTRKEFYKADYILGNNCNTGEGQKFEGALVGDPTHNSDYAKFITEIGEVLMLFNNLDDFDFKALYPSITSENNMAPNTQIGKIIIDKYVHSLENPYYNPYYDRGGQFTEDLVSENYLEFCARWLGLGRIKEVLEDMNEYFDTHIPTNILNPREPFHVYNKDGKTRPFDILDEDEKISPFSILPDYKEIKNVVESLGGVKK